MGHADPLATHKPAGVLVAVTGSTVVLVAHAAVPSIPPLFVALGIGVGLGHAARRLGAAGEVEAGAAWTSRWMLRAGVVLLGFQVSAGDAARIGLRGLLVVTVIVAATFLGALVIGARLRLAPGFTLLIAAGFSICGASAVAAMGGVAGAEEEEVAYTISLVTLCGTLAMFALPLLRPFVGLGDVEFGAWTGASVHDVAQVVGTAAVAGPAALHAAVIVKLARVLLLGPLVAVVALQRGARGDVRGATLIPGFVALFLVAIVLRTAGAVPAFVSDAASALQILLFVTALVALGMRTDVGAARRLAARPVWVALAAWAIVAALSLVTVEWVV